MSDNNKQLDLLNGSLWDKILFFALPLAASSILQQLFNSADVAVIGRFAGSTALAAVGANSALINLFVNSFVGLSVGSTVVIANLIGQRKEEDASKAVHVSILMATVMGIVLMVFGLIFADGMLRAIATPDDILDLAVRYLRIYSAGIPFIMLYNFEAAILRSVGNTKRPLISLAISGVINVILNLIFVVGFGMSVEGVAIATVISNIISSLDLFRCLLTSKGVTALDPSKIRPDGQYLKAIAKIGMPASLQGAMFSIANVIIQSAINGFGSITIAASAAAVTFEYYAYFFHAGFNQANVTFISQNYGAGQMDRCKKIMKISAIENTIVTIVANGLFVLFARQLMSIFTSDPAVIEVGVVRMYILLSFELLNMCIELFSGAMRGYGRSMAPAVISIVCICGLRLVWVYLINPIFKSFAVLMVCYPVSWLLTTIVMAITYMKLIHELKKKHNQ